LDAGAGFTTYLWSTGQTTQTIQAGGQGAYGITVTNASGCSTSGSIFVVKSATYPVDLGPANLQICDRGEIMLVAGPQYTSYDWSNGSGNQFLNVTQPGVYSVTATDAWGCVSNDLVTVTAAGIAPLDFLPTTATVCAGEAYLIDAGAQWDDYLWGTGNGDQYFLTTTPGTFHVTVTDVNGCRFFDSVVVVVETPPHLELGPNVSVCPGEVLDIDAGAGYDSYAWSTGSNSQTIQVNAAGDYAVTVTFHGCILEDVMNIGDDCPGRIFIPNVFSPNGDGLNDSFQVTYINLETLTVKIYDRWGKFLYTSNDKDFKWNGRYNDNPLPEGTYYWTINFKYSDNENPEEKRGTVMILR
jgi:gliding motility-associated-like protein